MFHALKPERRARFTTYLALVLMLTWLSPAALQAQTVGPEPAAPVHPPAVDLSLLTSDAIGVDLVVRVPRPLLTPASTAAGAFTVVTLPGFAASDSAGYPALPQHSVLLGLPPGAQPAVTVVTADWETLPEPVRPLPAALHLAARQSDGRLVRDDGTVAEVVPAVTAYAADGPAWPPEPAVLGEVAWLRDLRVAPLHIRPVRWQPATGQLQVARTLHLRVTFHDSSNGGSRPAAASASVSPDPWFEDVLRGAVLNFETAQAWRQSPAAVQAADTGPTWTPTPGQPWWKLGVTADGLYALTPTDLAAAGLDLTTVDPRRLQLWDEGRQVRLIYVGNEGDGAFDGSDKLLWLGRRSTTRYTTENIYWLTVGNQSGLRAGQTSAQPTQAALVPSYMHTARFEENKTYVQDSPHAEVADRWYGQKLTAGSEYSFQLAASALAGSAAELTVRLLGVSFQAGLDPDHHVRVWVNSQLVGDIWWDGNTAVTRTFSVPAGLLVAGANTVRLRAPGDTGAVSDVSHLDWVELRYPRQFVMPATELSWEEGSGPRTYRVTGLAQAEAFVLDVTDPWAPLMLTNAEVQPNGAAWQVRFSRATDAPRRHLVATPDQLRQPARIERDQPGDWSAAQTGADYLVISHSNFSAAMQPLLDWRRGQGMRTALIDVQEIYDAYSDGQMDAAALRAFFSHAYTTWPRPAPAFVLLVGNGHYDFQNFLHPSDPRPVFVPPWLGCLDPWLCEVASDNRYVTVSGDDPLPDMAIGRLPVRTVDQATTTVAKILGYEQAPPAGDWRQRVLFVSDNTHSATGQPDPAGNFELLSEAVIAMLPGGYTPVRVYYDPYPTDDAREPFRYDTPAKTTNAILAAINEGQFIVNYVGHAGTPIWAHEWLLVAPSRDRNDVALMTNGSRLAIGLSMGCLSGNFADPTYRSLDAEMAMAAAGGTVASWGATGFGVATGHDHLHQGFYDAIFRQGVTRLGLVTTIAKLDLYAASQSHRDLIDTFVLIGDPATRLPFGSDLAVTHQPPAGPLAPGDRLTYTVRVQNRGDAAYAEGAELALTLPPLQEVNTSLVGLMATAMGDHSHWALGRLAAGAAGTLTITGRLAGDAAASDTPLRFQARLLGAWSDRNLTDNVTTAATVAATPADLAISWQSNHTLAVPGSSITAHLNFRNQGSAPTGGGRVVVDVPAGLRNVRIGGMQLADMAPSAAAITVTLPSLAAGASGSLLLLGDVAVDATGGVLTLTGRGRAHWLDADSSNDVASLTWVLAAADAYEPDDTLTQATPLSVPSRSLRHTIHRRDDRDWFRFTAQQGRTYHILVENLSPGADTVLTLYDANAAFVAKNDNYTRDVLWSGLDWVAPVSATYYFMITGWTADPLGFAYDVSISTADLRQYFPMVQTSR